MKAMLRRLLVRLRLLKPPMLTDDGPRGFPVKDMATGRTYWVDED